MSVAIALIFILVGLLHIAFPYASWYISIVWKIRDSEPSEAYLVLSRLGGGLAAGIGLIVLVVGVVQTSVQASHQMDGFVTFSKEMTVKNIISIQEQMESTQATRSQIREFVQDIHHVDSTYTVSGGNSFSAMSSFTITCRDGYQASLINVDNSKKRTRKLATAS